MSYFDPGPSTWRYVVRMGLTSLLPSIALILVVSGVIAAFGGLDNGGPQFPEPSSSREKMLMFFLLVVFSPATETLLMSPILWVLSWVVRKPVILAVLSAAVWAGLHSMAAPAWGVYIAWPFYVFSRAYLAWRPYGWWRAVGVTMCIHAFQNLLPGLAMFLTTGE